VQDKNILQFFKDLFGGVTTEDIIYFTEKLKTDREHQINVSNLESFLKQHKPDRTLFFTPNLFQPGTIQKYGKERLDNNVRMITCLFWDFDTFRIDHTYLKDRGFPTPTYWFRRGDRSHIYYIFKEPIPITSKLDPNAKKITKLLKIGQTLLGADPAPAHIGSVMRCPGTIHIKEGMKNPGYELPIREGNPEKYNLRDFDFILIAAGGGDAKKVETTEKRKKKTPVSEALSSREIKDLLLDSQNIITAGAGRSNALFRFGIRCRDWGLEEEEALKVGAQFNKLYCNPPEEKEIVEHQVSSAYKYASGPAGKFLSKSTEAALEEFRIDLHIGHCLRDWVYVQDNSTLRHLKKPIAYQADQIPTTLSFLTGMPIKISYVVGSRLIQVCDKMSFRPDLSARIWEDDHHITYFNSFAGLRTLKPTGDKIHVKRFRDHLKYLTRTDEEADHLEKYFAVSLCYPEKKIRHALVFVSPHHGTGKGSLEKLFETVLRSPTGHSYISRGDNQALKSGWNDFIDSNLITFFHEVTQDKYVATEHLKTWITETKIRINGKFTRNYETDNYTNFILTTNNIGALLIDMFDRKYYIVECREKPRDAAYYQALHESFVKGAGDIVEYLQTRKDELDIFAHAPMTDSKLLMQAQSKSEVVLLLDDMYESEDSIFEKEFSLKSLMDTAYMCASISVRGSITRKAVTRWLLARGFQHRQKRSGEDAGWKYYPPPKPKAKKSESA